MRADPSTAWRGIYLNRLTKVEHPIIHLGMAAFASPPAPITKLGRYRQLAPRAAMHVSPLALGAMSIGDKWAARGMGAMDKESSFKLLDAYFDAGGELAFDMAWSNFKTMARESY